MRNGASVSQLLQLSVLPRGARITRVGSWRGSVFCKGSFSGAFMARFSLFGVQAWLGRMFKSAAGSSAFSAHWRMASMSGAR